MKFAIVLFGFVAVCLANNSKTFGEFSEGDVVVHEHDFRLRPRKGKIVDYLVSIPENILENIPSSGIKAIDVIDRSRTGHGGTPEIISGSLGEKTIAMQFTSEKGRGLNWKVKFYTQKLEEQAPASEPAPEAEPATEAQPAPEAEPAPAA